MTREQLEEGIAEIEKLDRFSLEIGLGSEATLVSIKLLLMLLIRMMADK